MENNLKLQAAAQGIDDVWNKSFVPNPTNPDAVALFNKQQKHMISVFSTVLKTTKGKELVHQCTDAHNAQKVCEELVEHCLKSAHADEECSKITDFLVNAHVKN